MADSPEGQESVYVILDLEDAGHMPAPGSRLLLQGMETMQPTLQLADGTRLVGAFEETVGTQLLLADTVQPDGSHKVHLVGHTDKRIRFSKTPTTGVQAEAAEAAMEEEEAGGGAEPADTEAAQAAAAGEAGGGAADDAAAAATGESADGAAVETGTAQAPAAAGAEEEERQGDTS